MHISFNKQMSLNFYYKIKVMKMQLNIEELVGVLLQDQQKSSLIWPFVHGKPLKSECRPQSQVPSLLPSEKLSQE
jgi:hypothetical protein